VWPVGSNTHVTPLISPIVKFFSFHLSQMSCSRCNVVLRCNLVPSVCTLPKNPRCLSILLSNVMFPPRVSSHSLNFIRTILVPFTGACQTPLHDKHSFIGGHMHRDAANPCPVSGPRLRDRKQQHCDNEPGESGRSELTGHQK
jgi:hypothetical protein